jgi:hypothetical protein
LTRKREKRRGRRRKRSTGAQPLIQPPIARFKFFASKNMDVFTIFINILKDRIDLGQP